MDGSRLHRAPGLPRPALLLAWMLALLTLAVAARAQDKPRIFPETYRSPTAPAPGVVERLSEPERQCFNALQGKVAWNKSNNMQWADSNKLRLCEGTQYGEIRVECFKRQVAIHDDWQLAILACKTAEQSLQPQRLPDDFETRLAYTNCVVNANQRADAVALCNGQFMRPADPPSKAMDGVLPATTAFEKDCMESLQGKVARGPMSTLRTDVARRWLESSLRKVCEKTPNPGWTVDCVKQQFAKGNPEETATAFCNTAMQATLGFTVPPPARPSSLTKTSCDEIVQCMLDTARGFSPADVCDSCSSGALSAVEKVRSAIETVSVGSACGAANEIKWLKDTITGGPVAALNLTLCQLGVSATSSLDNYCRGDCASQCNSTYPPGRNYDGCMLRCGCSVGKFLCESVTAYAASAVCKGLGLPD